MNVAYFKSITGVRRKLLSVLNKAVIGSRINPQNSTPTSPPWFEGWYTRVIGSEHSFGLVTGYFPEQSPKHPAFYTGLLFNDDSKSSKLRTFESYVDSSRCISISKGPGAEPNLAGASDAPDFCVQDAVGGSMRVCAEPGGGLLLQGSVQGAQLTIQAAPGWQHTPWTQEGGSPQGLLHCLPGLGLHWYVHSTKTRVTYELTLPPDSNSSSSSSSDGAEASAAGSSSSSTGSTDASSSESGSSSSSSDGAGASAAGSSSSSTGSTDASSSESGSSSSSDGAGASAAGSSDGAGASAAGSSDGAGASAAGSSNSSSTGSTAANSSGSSSSSSRQQGQVICGEGWAHVEKNWGASFPRSFIWSQGFSTKRDSSSAAGFDTEAQFCLAGGVLPTLNLDKLPVPLPNVVLLGYRSPQRTWNFKHHNPSLVSTSVQPDQGLLTVTARQIGGDLTYRTLILRIHANPETFSRIGGPSRSGFVPHSVESYSAKATAECYEWGKLVEVTSFDRSALEFGGSYACELLAANGGTTDGLVGEPQ